jgi:2-oxoglutarate ferredoxin oxidoreductase subunit alpha
MVGQSDVQMARWGSHGEYGVVAYAPASPQECFDLTVRAFNTADAYRMPVFILMDETLGHLTERVVIPEEGAIERIARKRVGMPSHPSLPGDDLVPPMAHAGEGHKVHLTGLTHDERGYPVLTPDAHERLGHRLVNKVRLNADKLVMVEEYALDDAETVIISFGCAARSARRAAVLARQQGLKVGMLRLLTLWPFPAKNIEAIVAHGSVRRFIVPEVNLGQVRREVERLTSLPVQGINHPGGAVMTPDTILEATRS